MPVWRPVDLCRALPLKTTFDSQRQPSSGASIADADVPVEPRFPVVLMDKNAIPEDDDQAPIAFTNDEQFITVWG